jgi:hypothetical protein
VLTRKLVPPLPDQAIGLSCVFLQNVRFHGSPMYARDQ